MTEQEVKAAVRERDGFKCRKCGKTNKAQIKENGRNLDVHRVIPGVRYSVYWCITLCRKCHASMPKKMERAYWPDDDAPEPGVRFLPLNLFIESDREIWERLSDDADKDGSDPENMFRFLLRERLFGESLHYVI